MHRNEQTFAAHPDRSDTRPLGSAWHAAPVTGGGAGEQSEQIQTQRNECWTARDTIAPVGWIAAPCWVPKSRSIATVRHEHEALPPLGCRE